MKPGHTTEQLVTRFTEGTLQAGTFGHREHLQVACWLLQHHDFFEACGRFSAGAYRLADSAGHPEYFNATLTFAFMSLIAEKMDAAPVENLDAFIASNQDLMQPDLLRGWYSEERLQSTLAKKQFLMPDRRS